MRRLRSRALWIGASLVLLGSGGNRLMFSHAFDDCPAEEDGKFLPLLSTCVKATNVRKFWKSQGGVVYWHIQKTGGTTMCRTAVAEGVYTEKFWNHLRTKKERDRGMSEIFISNCRSGLPYNWRDMKRELIPRTVSKLHRRRWPYSFENIVWDAEVREGRLFFAMEPSVCMMPCIRFNYPDGWFKQEWFSNKSSVFWDSFTHVVTVRDPAERFLSDFRQRDFDTKYCPAIGLTEEACIGRMLTATGVQTLVRAWDRAKLPGAAIARVIQTRLLSNAIVMHMGGTWADGDRAKENLRRMSLILDLRARPDESDFLLRGLFSGLPNEASLQNNTARFHDSKPMSEVYPDHYVKLTEILELDFKIWRYSLELIDEHAARLGFRPAAAAVGDFGT